jgi:sulfane dehydrogenase subunit SoxC
MDELEPVAGNGLLGRRALFKAGLVGGAALLTAQANAASKQREPWMNTPGAPMDEIGEPSIHTAHIKRVRVGSVRGTTGTGSSRTPLELLDGIITPSRLHFERHHNGIPDIDPNAHQLIIHGLVDRPLAFDLASLHRYRQVSRIQFLECSGNSAALVAANPAQSTASGIHGLVSCSEWGGVPLAELLEEAGVKKEARWIVAGGADAALMSRSVPLDKVMDDALIALHQNGEPLRPSNGYPMRLFLPGWEGNASVKWLRSIKLTGQPGMTKDETSKYSDLGDDGRAQLFTFPMGVKSVITSPSPGLTLGEKGVFQISGIAWSGADRIQRVDVSADGGATWAEAQLDDTVLPKALTRFRAPWRWEGGAATLVSRAVDASGAVQPTRAQNLVGRASNSFYHMHCLQAWRVDEQGELTNVYV